MISHRSGLAVSLAVAALLQGCAEPPPVFRSSTRLYAIDLQGAARVCTAPKEVTLTVGKPTPAAITVGNDGGWCAISVSQEGPHPYAAGLLRRAPEHGTVYIHAVGDATRIDYTPDHGYAGPDSYEVAMLPGQPALTVTVSVVPPAAPPPPAK